MATQSDVALQEWSALNAEASGVYRGDAFVYSAIYLEWDNSNRNELRRNAAFRAKNQLVKWIFTDNASRPGENQDYFEEILRFYKKRISLQGRVIHSRRLEREFQYVIAVPMERIEMIRTSFNLKEAEKQLYGQIVADPKSVRAKTFEKLGLMDLAMISSQSAFNADVPFANVDIIQTSPLEYRERYAAYKTNKYWSGDVLLAWYGEKAAFEKLVSKQSDSTSNQLATLTVTSLRCADPQIGFSDRLNSIGILDVSAQPKKNSFLNSVVACSGFVRFPESASSEQPQQMPLIRRLFQEGRELHLAIYLLEQAAEESPANKAVWEHLGAAYKAANNLDLSMIAHRVLISLDLADPEALRAWADASIDLVTSRNLELPHSLNALSRAMENY